MSSDIEEKFRTYLLGSSIFGIRWDISSGDAKVKKKETTIINELISLAALFKIETFAYLDVMTGRSTSSYSFSVYY